MKLYKLLSGPWSTNNDGAYFKASFRFTFLSIFLTSVTTTFFSTKLVMLCVFFFLNLGKTTTDHLAAKELGYNLVEMNATDTRNKEGS